MSSGLLSNDSIVVGSFNQSDVSLFGETAGSQCSCIALYATFWSQFRNIFDWKTPDLDKILIEGDKLYKSLKTYNYLSFEDLPRVIETNGIRTDVYFSDIIDCELSLEQDLHFLHKVFLPYMENQEINALIIIDSFTIAIFKRNDMFYLFNSHSCDDETGFLTSDDGKSFLVKFFTIHDLQRYIQTCFLECRSLQSLYFQIQLISFPIIENSVLSALRSEFRNFRRRNTYSLQNNKDKRKEKYNQEKEKASQHYQNNKVKFKQYYQKNKGKIKEYYLRNRDKIKKRHEKNKSELKRKRRLHYKKNNYSEKKRRRKYYQKNKKQKIEFTNTTKSFKESILQGPFFICVCCHRCLYQRSVVVFSQEKYQNFHLYCSEVLSFDGNLYICKTCHIKIKKNIMPCQSVKNSLEIYDFPPEFCGIRRLEGVLISRRILFKKIFIMPKGQSPKLRGSICNIPVDVEDVVKSLPRRDTNNGILYVKLKRNLGYKGHVIFEAVRPKFVHNLLLYLKENNPLYNDIDIDISDNIEQPGQDIDSFDFEIDMSESNNSFLHEISLKDYPFDQPIPIVIEGKGNNDDKLETALNPLDAYCSTANETTLLSNIPNEIDIDNEILTLAPGQGKKPISFVSDENCELLAHPHLFPLGKFGYKYKRQVPISASKYFNQRLLNYTQKFASDSDYIFYANSVNQLLALSSQINVAMKKISSSSLNAGLLTKNFKETVKQFIANDKAFAFMSTVKGTPAYWKRFLHEVLAMVKHFGPPSFFLTLSCADLRWNELISIIYKLKGEEVSAEFINGLTYQKRCELLNSNPVLVARHFQYRVETFFKHFILNGPLGKTIYYAIRVEFQVRGSPHIHSFIWTENAPCLTSKTKSEYIQHVDGKIRVSLPSAQDESNLCDLVKTFQLHRHSKTCRKYKNTECRFHFGKFFTEKTTISEPLSESMSTNEKTEILLFRKEILTKVKSYINENLNPSKKNFFNPLSENFYPAPSINEILSELNISKADYEFALSTSPDNDFHIHLRRPPDSCFVNNYFPIGLLAWEANIDIQPVFNHYKAITYMCSYLSKTENEVSNAMNQAIIEAYENKSDKYQQMKTIANAYVTKREVSVQEAVYLNMPELWLRKIFPGVTFANTNLPNKRFRICLDETELNELPEESTLIFKQNMLDRYCDRPNINYCNGKYKVIAEMCYAEFLRFYTLKSKECKDNDCQPNEFSDYLIETNHRDVLYPKQVPLMSSSTKLHCRKVPLVLRYYEPNQNKHPEEYAHHLLMLYYPFQNENDLLSIKHNSYIEKLNEANVLDIVNRNRSLIQPYSEMVDEALVRFNDEMSLNLNDFEQQENDEINDDFNNSRQFLNDFEEEDTNLFNLNSFPHPTVSIESRLLKDDELNARIRSLNDQQWKVFNIIYKWGRDFVKNLSCKTQIDVDPFLIFLTGGAGVGKSHLLSTVYHSLSKLLMYKGGEPTKQRILVLAPTGVAAINVGGTTIHSGLVIPTRGKLFPLSDKTKADLRLKLSCVEMVIIDEISMVSQRLFQDVNTRLCEVFNCEKPFGGKSILLSGDLYQLAPVTGKSIHRVDLTCIQSMIGFELWEGFQMAELTEVMRQRKDIAFIDLLNQVRTGNLDHEHEHLLKSRIITKDNADYPIESIHIFAENAPVDAHNSNMLNKLPTKKYEIFAIDELPKHINISNTDMNFITNAKPSHSGGLPYLLELKEGARVMISKNIDIEDKLVNGQVGTVMQIKSYQNKVVGVFVKLDDTTAGTKAIHVNSVTRQNNWILVERAESTFNLQRHFNNYPSVRRTQFPLMLSWACTCHKVQGLSLQSAVVSLELFRQRQFNAGQLYVALSRVTRIDGLFLIGDYNKNAIKINKEAAREYERLREKSQSYSVCQPSVFAEHLKITLLNVRSMQKHADDIVRVPLLQESDVLCLTETQIGIHYDTTMLDEKLKNHGFSTIHNKCSINPFQNTAFCHKSSVDILDSLTECGFFLLTIKKQSFSTTSIKILLLYRSPNYQRTSFINDLVRILGDNNIDIILGDFNIDALDSQNDHLKLILPEFDMVVNEPTHLDGGLLDHIYIKKIFVTEKMVECSVKNIYFSDHDSVNIVIY